MGFTPNVLTVLGFLVVLGASWVIAEGPLPVAGVILLAGACFDLLDGAVARVTGKISVRGAFLDSTLDRLSDAAMFLGLIWRYHTAPMGFWAAGSFRLGPLQIGPLEAQLLPGRSREANWGIALALTAMILGFMVSYIRARAEGLDFECKVGIAERPERVVIMAVGLLLNRPIPALVVLVLLSAFTLIQRFVHVWKQASARSA
jgi:CDP-diacylglycerol--glycerol-3-phosphate 3-phosphatidyltransferase